MSSGVPRRSSMMELRTISLKPGSLSRRSLVCEVTMSAGEMVLARMWCLAPSEASCRVMASTPPLVAQCASAPLGSDT